MVDPAKALAVGALAVELLRPQRVKNLEEFFAQNPHAVVKVEQALGYGAYVDDSMRRIYEMMFSPQGQEPQIGVQPPPITPEVPNEGSQGGPFQGPDTEQL